MFPTPPGTSLAPGMQLPHIVLAGVPSPSDKRPKRRLGTYASCLWAPGFHLSDGLGRRSGWVHSRAHFL